MTACDSMTIDIPTDGTANGLFKQLVAAACNTGEHHVAIVDGDVRLTYSDLLRAAGNFCRSLERAGVRPGDRVAVILGNRHEFLVSAFGIWKRGAVLTPLNPQLRAAEVASCLLESSARALVTTLRHERIIRSLQGKGVPIDHAWLWLGDIGRWMYEGPDEEGAVVPVDPPTGEANPNQPAVTQYSTGSTGRPKRVTRSDAQLLGEIRSVATVMDMTTADRILGAAPFFHSYGLVVSSLLTLLSGGTLYALDTFLPRKVGRLIEGERLSGLPVVPSMFQLLTECNEERDFSSLRFCLSAGAPLAKSVADDFAARYGRKIRSLYGSTETGVICISEDRPGDDVGSVGTPIPGVSVDVVDDAGHVLSAGQDGLVMVRSDFAPTRYDGDLHVTDSYFTDKGFIPGDNGRIDATGKLTLGSRRRNFINTHGYKVDPAEVERVLLELPGVTEAVVVGVSDGSASEKIKAVLIAPSGSSQKTVREHCIARLALFKCPEIIEFRSELPKNSLGKVLGKYLLDETLSGAP